MYRMYFDKNVFSYLRSNSKYSELANKLLRKKESLLFMFSQAHIEDIKQDKSNYKYIDLDYIEKYTNSFYMFFNPLTQSINIRIATPQEVYDSSLENSTSTNLSNGVDLESLLKLKDLPMFKEYAILFDSIQILLEKNANRPESYKIDNIPANTTLEMQKYLDTFGLENKEYTWDEWEKLSKEMTDILQNQEGLYKLGRRLGIEELGINKFDISIEDINFDEKLKETKVGKSFSDFFDEMMKYFKDVPLFNNFYLEYIMKYAMLNVLGIDKEKSKNLKFHNVMTDSQHSYYGIFSDYFVTCDKGLLMKSKFFYNFLGLNTKVLSLEEFQNEFSFLEETFNDIGTFYNILQYDIENGLVINHQPSILDDQQLFKIKLSHRYFSYFNYLEISSKHKTNSFILVNDRTGIDDFITYKEIENVVNQIVKLFGTDDNGQSNYNSNDEKSIKENNWDGRIWTHLHSIFKICYLSDLNKLVMVIIQDKD